MVNRNLLGSYVDAMVAAAHIINLENPDFIVAPMLGSVPFIDAMNIVDRDFDPTKVVYMPASSKIAKVHQVIRGWYTNFLADVVRSPDFFPKILGIDEVVSGSSVTRCFKGVDEACDMARRNIRQSLMEQFCSDDKSQLSGALRDLDLITDNRFAAELGKLRNKYDDSQPDESTLKEDSRTVREITKTGLSQKLVYRTIGIEEDRELPRHNTYEEAKSAGRISPVSIRHILTMDKPGFCPPQFEELDLKKDGMTRYGSAFSPKVQNFVVTSGYIAFLRDLAAYVGKNPDSAAPVNMGSILTSSKYLPEEFQ